MASSRGISGDDERALATRMSPALRERNYKGIGFAGAPTKLRPLSEQTAPAVEDGGTLVRALGFRAHDMRKAAVGHIRVVPAIGAPGAETCSQSMYDGMFVTESAKQPPHLVLADREGALAIAREADQELTGARRQWHDMLAV